MRANFGGTVTDPGQVKLTKVLVESLWRSRRVFLSLGRRVVCCFSKPAGTGSREASLGPTLQSARIPRKILFATGMGRPVFGFLVLLVRGEQNAQIVQVSFAGTFVPTFIGFVSCSKLHLL